MTTSSMCAGALAIGLISPAYGAADTVIYTFASKARGLNPIAGLVLSGHTLLGTASIGGVKQEAGFGTLFRVSQTGRERTFYKFQNGTDGSNPATELVDVGGTFYGATASGSGANRGSIFSVTAGGKLTVLHQFAADGSEGYGPVGPLTLYNGDLYGVTVNGGTAKLGVAFRVTTGGAFSVLHSFGTEKGDGMFPAGGLLADGATLYGATAQGGAYGEGAVYTLSPNGAVTILHSFRDKNLGYAPSSNLVKIGSAYYGATSSGGTALGVLYKLSAAGKYALVHAFSSDDGQDPEGTLIVANGTLYGAARLGGGTCNCGTIYALTTGDAFTTLYAFQDAPDGAFPNGGLVYDQGALFGTTQAGGKTGAGTVFRLGL